jgi:hypothetical protein
VLADGGFAGGFRAEDFGNASARDAADAEGDVERERTGGDGFDDQVMSIAETHDGAFAKAFIQVAQRTVERVLLAFVHVRNILYVLLTVYMKIRIVARLTLWKLPGSGGSAGSNLVQAFLKTI